MRDHIKFQVPYSVLRDEVSKNVKLVGLAFMDWVHTARGL